MLDYPPFVHRKAYRSPYRLPFRSPAGIEGVLASALVDLNEDGIVTDGSGYVTAWNNSGLGGPTYNLDTVVGTLSNSSTSAINGHTIVTSAGSYGLESSSGQTISAPGTVLMVARHTPANPAADQYMMAPRSDANSDWSLYSRNGQADRFSIFQGAAQVTIAEAYNTNFNLWIGQFNGDVTTQLSVVSVGSVIGNAGPDNWDYGTIFATLAGTATMQGDIARLLAFAPALSPAKIAQLTPYLLSEYALL